MSRMLSTANAMRGATAIPLETAIARFPTLATTCAAPDRSARYTQITTADVLTGLAGQGFEIFSTAVQRTLDANRRPFAKHIVRLRHHDAKTINGATPEICLINSHNGRSAFQLFAGVFRMICSNGLFVGDTFAAYKVRHTGDIVGDVIDASFSVVSQFDAVTDSIEAMSARLLSWDERQELAARALDVRYPDGPTPFAANELLHARRIEDTGADLWTVFNRVQENLTQGGLRGFAPGSSGRIRQHTMRPITGLDSDLRVNRALWNIAADYLPKTDAPRLIAAE